MHATLSCMDVGESCLWLGNLGLDFALALTLSCYGDASSIGDHCHCQREVDEKMDVREECLGI